MPNVNMDSGGVRAGSMSTVNSLVWVEWCKKTLNPPFVMSFMPSLFFISIFLN
jgi:hypothetical protein